MKKNKEAGIYNNLNEDQKRAVDLLEGPVLILAGPGTGKTQLLSVRAANIMKKKHISGENILILTFTNSAAKAVKERLANIIGFKGYEVIAETFHSFANSIILDSEEAAQYIKMRIQMSDIERVKAIEYIIDNFEEVGALRPFGDPYYYRDEIEKKISELKNEGITPLEFEAQVEKNNFKGELLEEKHVLRLKALACIYKKYEEIKNGTDKKIFDERGRYDYDDMILLATESLNKQADLKNTYQKKYAYIMVDEFQDTNGAQLKLLFELLKGEHPNICCVGDDDQSIYRFQGASRANFRILKEKLPGLVTIKLKKNYRSTKDILDLSSRIIRQIPGKERMDEKKILTPAVEYAKKTIEVMNFSTEDEEILYIINRIKEIKSIIENSKTLTKEEKEKPYNNIAILVRKRASILKLIDGFLRAGIPYTTDGKEDISMEKRVRQLIDVLRIASPTMDIQEKDILLYKILISDYLRIPHNDILKFIEYVNYKRKKSAQKEVFSTLLSEFIDAFHSDAKSRPEPDDTKKLSIVKIVPFEKPFNLHIASWAISRLLEDSDSRPVHDAIMRYINDANLYNFLLKEYEDKKLLRIRDLRAISSFINMIKNLSMSNPEYTVSDFISELELRQRHRMPVTGELVTYSQDGVKIITAHASKGLEFHTVIIPFCLQDKSWPLKRYAEKIPIPASIIKSKERVESKTEKDLLTFFDETRLFYVASSRAKAFLIFTASPSEKAIESSFFRNIEITPKKYEEKEEEILKNFFIKEDEEDLFKHSDKIVKSMIKDLVLTPTKINTYLHCKRRFLYNSVLLLPGRKRQSLVFGDCVHKTLEDVYGKFKREGYLPDFAHFKNIFSRYLKYQAIDNSMRSRCEAKLPILEKWYEKVRKEPIVPLDLEKSKKITLKNGIIFSGKFDKIEFEDEGQKLIRVIDYKTGKPDKHIKKIDNAKSILDEACDDYLRQVVAYKLLYERDTYEKADCKVSHGMLVFLEPADNTVKRYNLKKGEYIDKKIKITDEMVSDMEHLIIDTWDRINNLEFDKLPEKDKEKCPHCDFCSICWQAG